MKQECINCKNPCNGRDFFYCCEVYLCMDCAKYQHDTILPDPNHPKKGSEKAWEFHVKPGRHRAK